MLDKNYRSIIRRNIASGPLNAGERRKFSLCRPGKPIKAARVAGIGK